MWIIVILVRTKSAQDHALWCQIWTYRDGILRTEYDLWPTHFSFMANHYESASLNPKRNVEFLNTSIFSMVVRKGNTIINKLSCIRFANIILGILRDFRIYKHTFYEVLKPNRLSPHIFRLFFPKYLDRGLCAFAYCRCHFKRIRVKMRVIKAV